jgi:uncharacterized membrane protein YeiH
MAAGTPDLVLESVATVAFAVSVGAPLVAARWIAVAVAVGLRLLAIRFSWSLPRIPGRV